MRFTLALICAMLSGQIAWSQTVKAPHPIEESAARKNLLLHSDPIYPPIAKAAHIQGTVEVAVIIGSAGRVTWEKALSGPAMLQQSALDAVHRWTFKPFRSDGVVVPVSATLQIPFQIDKPGEGPSKAQEQAAQAWFPLSDKCRKALSSAQDKESALTYCKQALDTSFQAGDLTNSDQLARVDSHQYYGHALLAAGRFQEALAEENSAIEELKKCLTDRDQEYAMPFFWRALAEANLGQVDATLKDLQVAEETHRKAIAHLPEMKVYSQYLASILRQHAAFLDQIGRNEEADKLRAEATAATQAR